MAVASVLNFQIRPCSACRQRFLIFRSLFFLPASRRIPLRWQSGFEGLRQATLDEQAGGGIFFFEVVSEFGVNSPIFFAPVFITYFEIFEFEGLGMSVSRTFGTPFCRYVTVEPKIKFYIIIQKIGTEQRIT